MKRPSIDEVMARLEWQRGEELSVSPLPGGLTNENFLIASSVDRCVVRIPGASTELLAVDRTNERYNAEAAASTGVSPRILEYLDDWSVMALEYVNGETMSAERLREPLMPARIADSLKRLHGGPRFLHDFDMFRTTEYYLGIVAGRNIRIPTGFRERMNSVAEAEGALAVNAPPRVPCHNDLMASNYIDDIRQLWIIDFEYSGNGDPCFELGDTAQECGYDAELRTALCTAYFGREDPVQLARMELFAMMADVGWTLWAAIQSQISTIEYDFWGWAEERWGRVVTLLGSGRFDYLLADAAS